MPRFARTVPFALAGLLCVAVAPVSAQQQTAKVGFVNVQQILAQAPGLEQARTTFESEVQQAEPELQRMATELDSLQAQYERQQATLTEAARQQRQQDMQTKYNTLQQRQVALQQREQQLLAPITNRVKEVIELIRKEGNFAVIFDTAESGIVAADETLDLTNRVLDRLKTSAPAATPSAAPAAPRTP